MTTQGPGTRIGIASRADVCDTSFYQEAQDLHRVLRGPGTGLISDAAEVSTNGTHAVFAGTLVDSLIGTAPTRICMTDLATGDTRVLTYGPNVDRSPKFSPDGSRVAFLSDRHQPGDFQLYLLDPASGAVGATPTVTGWVEYLQWSPDGKKVLLGVAGHGADIAGGQGAVTSKQLAKVVPGWLPTVQTGDESYRWRRVWVYELASDSVREVSPSGDNIWEAVWCGNEALATVTSPAPDEGLWYSARLRVLDIEARRSREVFTPGDQLGWPAASPSGCYLAVVEAISSDRWIVAGDLRLIDLGTGEIRKIDTHGIDITYTEWRSEQHLLLAGHRGFESVVALYDTALGTFSEIWSSSEITTGGFYISVAALSGKGDCVLVGEGFLRAPEIAVIRQGRYHTVRSFDLDYATEAKAIEAVKHLSWNAPDGLQIQGYLLVPHGPGPYPVVMNVHGGPVSHWRPAWLGRRGVPILMLLKHGYAVFLPNPRGSSGRGQEFARHVWGDVGGADTYDYLAGLDYLVGEGIADPSRLGVTGGSYGGFMASWLITQDSRFAAAVPLAPVTNQVTAHLISNIPHYVALSLADTYTNPGGRYFQRSPVMHAHKTKTPTLNICGALDRCTPPEEAVQFHNALLENGVRSVLITYPQEGHGVRKWPAALDYTARLVAWFEEHMPAGSPSPQSHGMT